MSFSLRNLIAVNAYLMICIGVPVNLLLLWLILKKTIKEMRDYSLILLQACICDLFCLVIYAFTQPVILIDKEVSTIFLSGPAQALTTPWSCVTADISMFFGFISLYQQHGAQFYYRYVLTTQNRKISLRRYFLLLTAFPALLMITTICTQWKTIHNDVPYRGDFKNAKLGEIFGFLLKTNNNTAINEEKIGAINFAYRSENDLMMQVSFYLHLLCFGSSYLAVLICAVKTRNYVREYLIGPSEAVARDVNKQLQRTLCIQAVIPLFSLILTIFVTLCFQANFIVSKEPWTMALIWALMYIPLQWIIIVSFFVPMYTVRAYRQTIAHWISLINCREKVTMGVKENTNN